MKSKNFPKRQTKRQKKANPKIVGLEKKKREGFISSLFSRGFYAENVRVSPTGTIKPVQVTDSFAKLLKKHPDFPKRISELFSQAKLRGSVNGKYFNLKYFDPKDESAHHDALFITIIGGKKFFVKNVKVLGYPADAVSQFITHDLMAKAQGHLRKFNARVLQYEYAWNRKDSSMVIARFEEGIILEKLIKNKTISTSGSVYKRFLKVERIVREVFGARDFTTRNVLYNRKTGELILIDLMPSVPNEPRYLYLEPKSKK